MAIVEKRSMAFISAAVSTTPRRQLWAHTNTWWLSGTSVPTCTIFQGPLAGAEYSTPLSKGVSDPASFIVICAPFASGFLKSIIAALSAGFQYLLCQSSVLPRHVAVSKSLYHCFALFIRFLYHRTEFQRPRNL